MIDETNFFNLGSGAAEETRKWHEQHLKNRHRPMALLLTETVNPEAWAEDVLRSLAMEEAPLLRLRAEHERMMAQWRSENPAANPDDPFEGMSYWEIKEPPPSGKLSPVLLTTRGLKEMTSAALQRGCQS